MKSNIYIRTVRRKSDNSCWHKEGILGAGRTMNDCLGEVTIWSFRRFNLAVKLEINVLLKVILCLFLQYSIHM